MSTDLNNEIGARLNKDALQDSALSQEVADRIAGDDALAIAYAAADAAMQTAILAAVTASIEQMRDTTVSDLIPVVYTDAQQFVLADLLGAGRPDGVFAISFTSATSIAHTATVTGLPISAAGTGDIDFGDILRVKIDGGVVVSATKIDNIVAQKIASIDSSITTLMTATTADAIRAHFSATGGATLVAGVIDASPSVDTDNDLKLSTSDGRHKINVGTTEVRFLDDTQVIQDGTVNNTFTDVYAKIAGLAAQTVGAENGTGVIAGKVELGGALTKATTISGAPTLSLMSDKTVIRKHYQPVYDIVNGVVTESADVVGMWWSRSPSGNIEINYHFPGEPSPN
jgi:hypothetical protein